MTHTDNKAELQADNARLRKALEGVLHHNAAVKPQYQLPISLIRHIKGALEGKS